MNNLRQRLLDANYCCHSCGTKYGVEHPGHATYWRDVCDVCGLELSVSSVRNYGYLRRGIRECEVL